MKKRRVIAALAALTLSMTACSSNTGNETSEGPATIRYLTVATDDSTQLEAFNADIARFEAANPDIKVDVDQVPYEQLRNLLETQLRSGDGPDVFRYETGPQAQSLADSGMLLDLGPFYEKYGWKMYDWARAQVTFNDTTYGIPNEVEMLGMFYNKDKLSELGLEVPSSFADFPAYKKVTDKNGLSLLALGNLDGWPGGQMVSMSISSNNGADYMRSLIAGDVAWTDQRAVDAIQQVGVDFLKQGYYASDPSSIDYDRAASLFYSEKAIMYPTGTWQVGAIERNAKFDVGFVPFPGMNAPGTFTAGLGSGVYAAATTKHPEAVGRFLDYLNSNDHGLWQVETMTQLPAYEVDTSGSDLGALFKTVITAMGEASAGQADFAPSLDVSVPDTVVQALWTGFQEVLTGQINPDQLASDLQKAQAEK